MSDQNVAEGATVETTPTPSVEAGFSLPEGQQDNPVADQSSEPADTRDYEAEARSMGWVPEAEWKGERKPSKFLDAKDFVERGETVIPILRSQLERERKESEERFSKLEKMNQKTIERLKAQHAAELEGMKAKREEAVKAGNVDEFRKIDKQIADHEKSAPDNEPEPEATKEDPKAVEAEWAKNNDWYGKDETMTGWAVWYSQSIARPGLSMADNLKQTEEAVRKKFPLHFNKAGANGHAPVDRGSPNGAPPRKDTLTSKLNAEELRFAKQAVESGAYKTTEDWAKVYFEK